VKQTPSVFCLLTSALHISWQDGLSDCDVVSCRSEGVLRYVGWLLAGLSKTLSAQTSTIEAKAKVNGDMSDRQDRLQRMMTGFIRLLVHTACVCEVILLSLDPVFQAFRFPSRSRDFGLHLFRSHVVRHFESKVPEDLSLGWLQPVIEEDRGGCCCCRIRGEWGKSGPMKRIATAQQALIVRARRTSREGRNAQ